MSKSNSECATTSSTRKALLELLFWPLVIGTVACDLLGLCHLLPTHSQHLHRPYMLSMVQFKVFKN